MRLTPQMQAEIETMRARRVFLIDQVWVPLEKEMIRRGWFPKDLDTIKAIIAELKPYKVRLENILCETDIKEQAHQHTPVVQLGTKTFPKKFGLFKWSFLR